MPPVVENSINKKKAILSIVLLLIVLGVVLWLSPSLRRLVPSPGGEVVKGIATTFQDFKYLFVFNLYPSIELTQYSNFNLEIRSVPTPGAIATFQIEKSLSEAKEFFKSYLTANKYKQIQELTTPSGFTLLGFIGLQPISIELTKVSDSTSEVKISFELRYVTSARINK